MTEMRIPFLDLKRINLEYRQAFHAALDAVLDEGWLVLGKKVAEFGSVYAALHPVKHALGVSNGLDALVLCLKALDIGEGDEVIVPSNTYIATWLAVSQVGARPVPAEPRVETYNLDPIAAEKAITSRTKAVLAVNLYGQCAELVELKALCDLHGIHLVEDNAQAQGSSCQGRAAGSFGIINATSFYPGKVLGALGDAGAVTTDDDALAQRVRVLRNYGSQQKYINERKGMNMRLDELQAAFLLAKIPDLATQSRRRNAIAEQYQAGLENCADLVLPRLAAGCTSNQHLFVIRTPQRQELADHLAARGIGTMVHYPVPPHLQEAYTELGIKRGDLPIAEMIADTCLSLPMHHLLTEAEVAYICEQIRAFHG